VKTEIPTGDGITMQDIRLIAGEGKLSEETIQQTLAVIRKQRYIELAMLKGFIAGLDHVSYCRGGVKHIVTEIRQKAKDLRPVRDEVEE